MPAAQPWSKGASSISAREPGSVLPHKANPLFDHLPVSPAQGINAPSPQPHQGSDPPDLILSDSSSKFSTTLRQEFPKKPCRPCESAEPSQRRSLCAEASGLCRRPPPSRHSQHPLTPLFSPKGSLLKADSPSGSGLKLPAPHLAIAFGSAAFGHREVPCFPYGLWGHCYLRWFFLHFQKSTPRWT